MEDKEYDIMLEIQVSTASGNLDNFLSFRENDLYSINVSNQIIDSKFEIGKTACAEIYIDMIEPTMPNGYTIPKMAKLIPQIRIKETESTVSLWKRCGVYFIDTRKVELGYDENGRPKNKLIISGYDAMMKTSKKIEFTQNEITMLTLFSKILQETGIFPIGVTEKQVDSEIFEKKGIYKTMKAQVIPTSTIKYYTGREILGFIAACFGGSFYFDSNGDFKFADMSDLLVRVMQ